MIKRQDPSVVTFRLGVNHRNNLESWSSVRTVTDMFIHEDYNPYMNRENDIALFKLSVISIR